MSTHTHHAHTHLRLPALPPLVAQQPVQALLLQEAPLSAPAKHLQVLLLHCLAQRLAPPLHGVAEDHAAAWLQQGLGQRTEGHQQAALLLGQQPSPRAPPWRQQVQRSRVCPLVEV